MASSILLKFPRNTEVQEDKKTEISEALGRVRRPLDSTRITMKVMGVYALPEEWKSKLVSDRLKPPNIVTDMFLFFRTILVKHCFNTKLNWLASKSKNQRS